MGTFFAYMLKSALCLVAYYLFYKLLLSRDTFYRFNRFALVLLLVCSMTLPFVHWNWSEPSGGTVGVATIELPKVAGIVSPEVSLWDKLMALLLLVYLVGIAVFFLRTLVSYLSLWQMIRHCEERPMPNPAPLSDAHLMVTTDKVSPFSWMSYIVVNEQDLTENSHSILLHEMGHIRHHHTLDLVLTELCIIVQWFNPAIWLMREELQAIHEFEADEEVLNAGVNAREYQLLLIKKAAGSRLQSITNSLHQSSIKKRITMMQKKKSNRWVQAKYLLAVPVTALGVMLFATPAASAISAEISGCKVSNLFPNDQVLASENANPSAELASNEVDMVFTVVEELPEFTGGTQALMHFLAENLRYPAECADSEIQGRVVLSFVVEKDGTISSIEEMRSPDERLTTEAIRVVSLMPKWKPGRQRGQEVRVKYALPISFRLNNDKDGIIVADEVRASQSSNAPAKGLFLIDDKVVPYEELKNRPTGDIQSMEVLKDEATISQYIDQYPEAKNGVIKITLKK